MDNNPSTGSSAPAQNPPWMDTSLSPHERANLLLAQMTLAEKIEMVHGELPAPYGFYNAPVPRPGIPALTMADGPAGIRVARHGPRATTSSWVRNWTSLEYRYSVGCSRR